MYNLKVNMEKINKHEYYDVLINFLEKNDIIFEFKKELTPSGISIKMYIEKISKIESFSPGSAILGAFVFESTRLGYKYWSNINIKWKKYLENYTSKTIYIKSIW